MLQNTEINDNTVKSVISEGEYTVYQTIAIIVDKNGKEHEINMVQKWPVKVPMTHYKEKPRPYRLLNTFL
jgi:V/A-type H+-transporting ATPase subunit A